MSSKLKIYLMLFTTLFFIIVGGGFIASFFVEEPMHLTFVMLGGCVLFIPLLIPLALHNKAERYNRD